MTRFSDLAYRINYNEMFKIKRYLVIDHGDHSSKCSKIEKQTLDALKMLVGYGAMLCQFIRFLLFKSSVRK